MLILSQGFEVVECVEWCSAIKNSVTFKNSVHRDKIMHLRHPPIQCFIVDKSAVTWCTWGHFYIAQHLPTLSQGHLGQGEVTYHFHIHKKRTKSH